MNLSAGQNILGDLSTEPASCSVAPPVLLKRKRCCSPHEHNDEREDRDYIAAVDPFTHGNFLQNAKLPGPAQLSADACDLLCFIDSLGGNSVPLHTIFRRLQVTQKRWSTDGEIKYLTGIEANVHPSFQAMAFAQTEQLVVELSSYLTSRTSRSSSKERLYTIASPLPEEVMERASIRLEASPLQALRLICFVFPRERLWEQE